MDEFDGTLIFVSHDRYFIKKFANKIITFKNGNAKTSDCGYLDYISNLSEPSNKRTDYKEENSKGFSLWFILMLRHTLAA